jgi:polysaccharide deacetylase 2 family uncharacterized protein YibQ
MRAVIVAFALTCAVSIPVLALASPGSGAATLTIVIDDLGVNLAEGRRVLRLPGPVACAILPHQPFSTKLAEEAHAARKEVLLHLPMEPEQDHEFGPGPGHVDTRMPPLELRVTLDHDLETVPHAIGVNNHMGSRHTRSKEAMQRFLRVLRERGGLFFVDSRTSGGSVAAEVARAAGVPALTRDVFLDHDRSESAVERQLDQAVRLAHRHGAALAIGHPYPETLAVLERRLPGLRAAGVELAPVTRLLAHHTTERPAWPAYSSR